MYCEHCEEDWQNKYNKLLVNFKHLDRYNDVLYRLFFNAKTLRNSGYTNEALEKIFESLAEVERYEEQLIKSKATENINN